MKRVDSKIRFYAIPLLFVTGAAFLLTEINRPFWYDEALSIINFALLSYSQVYTEYCIANNHIFFTYLLKFWIDNTTFFPSVCEMRFRILSFLISMIVLLVIYKVLKKHFRFYTAFLITLSFAVSNTFVIYGTALRGYMLGLIFITLGLNAAMNLNSRGRFSNRNAFLYLFSALAAVAVLPTNIIAFAAIFLLTVVHRKTEQEDSKMSFSIRSYRKLYNGKSLFTAIAPIAAFLLFYLPLYKSILQIYHHNSGWTSGFGVLLHLYSAFIYSFIFLAIAGSVLCSKLPQKARSALIYTVHLIIFFILPAFVILSRNPAPFPRVFLQLWPIWLFIMAYYMRPLTVFLRKNRKSSIYFSGMILLVIIWGICQHFLSPLIADQLSKYNIDDDFFHPYYVKHFNPAEIVKSAVSAADGKPGRIYISPTVDYPAILLYGKFVNLPYSFWLFDWPQQQHITIRKTGEPFFLIVRNKKDAQKLKDRFNFTEIHHLKTLDKVQIYSAE